MHTLSPRALAERRRHAASGRQLAPLPPVDPAGRPPLAPTPDPGAVEDAWAAWQGHVDAGRIGVLAPPLLPAPAGCDYRFAALERILGIASPDGASVREGQC